MTSKETRGGATECAGIVTIDTTVWMRPKQAIKAIKHKYDFDVSPQMMYYWTDNNKVKTKIIESLDNLLLVNIETIPKKSKWE